ncbi:DUF6600 domain-containing protein [uncultured Chitinophaga sp.]|jgi:hypothetical protein|uniref:DUF6600 domain-containing protein n=1 Tax=uncultured Chitinophaga sp. TaxID=339340 RepID=UPI00262ACA8C|nr:DUF6600 domain-containing protein [uncultured Chitinophaga sp.]
MKSKVSLYASVLITCLFLTVFGSSCVTARPQQVQANVSFSAFYDALSPYGQWVTYGNYGQVWVPDAGRDFRPYYTNGHWVYTDYGWTWMSDYSWGWAPFHYGRWTYDNYYGWVWVPGEEWGPAWVSWRNSSDYYGWAPLTPGVSVGVNFNIPTSYWSFVPCRYITSPNIHNYYVDRSRNVTIINNTTVINNVRTVNRNTRYYYGPEARDVSRVTRSEVRPVRVVNSDRPGSSLSNNQLRIFRPQGEQLRRPLADNAPRRINDNNRRVSPAPNNVTQPGQPGRTIRRDVDNNNDPGNNNNNSTTPRRIFNNPDNRPATPTPAPNTRPDNNPAPDRTPRRTFEQPSNRPAPVPNNNNNNNRTAPEQTMPRRTFSQPQNRPAPQPQAQPRVNPAPQRSTPAPQQRANPAPQQRATPAPQRSTPQRSFSSPQPSSPRPQPAPQQRSNNNNNTPRRVQ